MNGDDKMITFSARVAWLIKQIPAGKVSTYGRIAFFAGKPRAARAVGRVLREGEGLPWQRVLNASGGISSKGSDERALLQRALLEGEGIVFEGAKLSLEAYLWEPEIYYWAVD